MNPRSPVPRLWPWAAALVVLLAAWLLPLPRLVQGEEVLAQSRLPATKANLDSTRTEFTQAQAAYKSYVSAHDMSALLDTVQADLRSAAADSGDPVKLAALRDAAQSVRDYAVVLQRYAQAGETYFSALSKYDDNLMAWTRDLGPASEQLRDDTFPFVEHLKLYPKPTGEKDDPPNVTAAQVAAQVDSLGRHVAALDPSPDPHSSMTRGQAVDAIGQDVAAIWASGRSIEYIESLHADYDKELQAYEQAVQQVAEQPSSAGPTGSRAFLANGLNLLVGLLLLVGIAAVFMPRRTSTTPERQS